MKLINAEEVIRLLEEDMAGLPRKTEYDEGFAAGCRWTILALKMAKEAENGKA